MPQPRTGYRKPVSPLHAVTSPISEMLPRDFDNIPEAEGEYRDLCLKGHVIETDVPRNS